MFNIIIIDLDSPLGKALGITKDSYKPFTCPRCGRISNEHISPHCGYGCNLIIFNIRNTEPPIPQFGNMYDI